MLDIKKDEEMIGRLYNWKFSDAAVYLRPDHPEHVRDVVRALASQYGNWGWANGGTTETIVDYVVGSLIGQESATTKTED